MNSLRRTLQAGFTLVEMLVVAPIIILSIGAFIVLIVNLTGEVMSSRGSNVLAYNLQDTLNRIEDDVKLSAGFLAKNSIAFDANDNPQGSGGVNSTADFTIADSSGQKPVLVLNAYATDGNPISLDSGLIYLADKPNSCSSYAEYSKNRPMTINIVYFVDASDTLWRRVVMPADYANPNTYCGSKAPWQQPTCIDSPSRDDFCKTNDEKLLEHVGASGFDIKYYTAASTTTPLAISSATTTTDLQAATTIGVSLSSTDTIAGREISKSGTLRVSRLDTNASAVGDLHLPSGVPSTPLVSATVADGHQVTFTWPAVPTATSYTLQYKVNSGSWSSAETLNSSTRSRTIAAGWNGDTVQVQVRANNTIGASSYGTKSFDIPVWSPLVLINGWTNYESTYAPASYTRTSAGVVLLRGLVKSGTIGDIAQLPADYRPDKYLMFENSSNQVAGRLDVRSNGVINMPTGSNAWASLDGVNFMPGNAYTDFSSFSNGWKNYSASSGNTTWGNTGYAVDSLGRVHTSGLVSSGTITDNTVITSFSSSLSPANYMHVANGDGNTHGLIGVNTNGTFVAKGYPNGYLSFNSMFYPASARASGSSCTTQWCDLALQNSWVYYGSPFTTPQYTKSSDGIVIVKGLIRAGNTGATIATLPQGFCPAQRLLMTIASWAGWARVDIVPDANPANGCTITPSAVHASWTSLDSLIFLAER